MIANHFSVTHINYIFMYCSAISHPLQDGNSLPLHFPQSIQIFFSTFFIQSETNNHMLWNLVKSMWEMLNGLAKMK